MTPTRSASRKASAKSCVTRSIVFSYPRLQLQELPLQLQPRQRVERPERLVEEEHRRVDGEGAGEGGALALAAGELERVARAVTVGVEPDERQRLA